MKKLQHFAVIAAMLLLLAQSVLGITSYFSSGSVPDGAQMGGQAPSMQMNGSSTDTSSTNTAQSTDTSTTDTEASTDSTTSGFDPSQGGNMPAMNGTNGPGAAGEKNIGELVLSIAGIIFSVGGLSITVLGWRRPKNTAQAPIV